MFKTLIGRFFDLVPTPLSLATKIHTTRLSSTLSAAQNHNHHQFNPQQQEKASLEQLIALENLVQDGMPKFFAKPPNLKPFTQDILFIDNIRGVKTKGLFPYYLQIILIKNYHIINNSYNKLELLNLVKIPEESCLKVRWRIVSKPGILQFALFFWKFNSTEYWKDGISTLHVNNQGKIFCHVCDNIDVDVDNKNKDDQSIKSRLVNRGLNVQIKA